MGLARLNEFCQKCGYEAEGLYSAGVHDSESGCIKVYTDDDEFVCPICTIAEMSDQGRDVPDTTLPDTGFNRIVIYRIPDIPDTG